MPLVFSGTLPFSRYRDNMTTKAERKLLFLVHVGG